MTTRVPWWRSLRLRIAVALAVVSAVAMGTIAAAVVQQSAADGRTRLREQAFERLEASAVSYEVFGRLRTGLTARLEREREFSADVAHELRTPVTALVSAAELLGVDEASGWCARRCAGCGCSWSNSWSWRGWSPGPRWPAPAPPTWPRRCGGRWTPCPRA